VGLQILFKTSPNPCLRHLLPVLDKEGDKSEALLYRGLLNRLNNIGLEAVIGPKKNYRKDPENLE